MSVKISELPVLAPEDVAAGDVVAIVDSSEGVTKQVDLSGVLAGVAIDAPSQLTQSQATDPDDETFGTVSGELLAAAFDERQQQVGVGQVWIGFDVPAERNHSTVYQNTTGRPIQWSLACAGSARQVQASPDGSNWISFGHTSSDRLIAYQLVIPDGWYYRINGSTGSITWSELR